MRSIGPKADSFAPAGEPEEKLRAGRGIVLPRALRKPVRHMLRILNGGMHVSRRGLILSGLAFGLVVLAGGLTASGQSGAFLARAALVLGVTVEGYAITGNREVTDIEIVSLLAPGADKSLVGFDVKAARDKLIANSWVAEATVSKVYPDTLAINIIERSPFALWQNEDGLQIIDRTGRVLTAFDGRVSDLPLVVGAGGETTAVNMLAILKRQPIIGDRVRALVRIGDRRWDLELDNGVMVMLPENDVTGQLALLAKMVSEAGLFDRAIKSVDLRLGGRIAMELTPEAAETIQNAREMQIGIIKKAGKGRQI